MGIWLNQILKKENEFISLLFITKEAQEEEIEIEEEH